MTSLRVTRPAIGLGIGGWYIDGMNVSIPPEFEAFARDQVKVGAVASEEEAVALALRDYLTRVDDLRAAADEGLADFGRGAVVEGETFMAELLAETKARILARTE